MRVGYTIVRLESPTQEKEFARFLREKLILEEGYADNIAKVSANGDSVNIYTQRILKGFLEGRGDYAFKTVFTEINVKSPSYLVASAVDFRLEIQYAGSLKVLAPTEYFITSETLARTLSKEIQQGLLRVYPRLPEEEGKVWILEEGEWNDNGVWMDEKFWEDYDEQ